MQICPVDAIIMMKVPASPVTLRSDLYLTKTKMMNNAIKYEESWAKGSILQKSFKPAPKEVEENARLANCTLLFSSKIFCSYF